MNAKMLEPAEAKTVIYTSLLGGDIIVRANYDILMDIYRYFDEHDILYKLRIMKGKYFGTIALHKSSSELFEYLGVDSTNHKNVIMISINCDDRKHAVISVQYINEGIDSTVAIEELLNLLFKGEYND